MDAGEPTPAQKLEEYKRLRQAEFDVPVSDLSQSDIRNKTKSAIVKTIPDAIAEIQFLAQHGESEQVKLSAAKFLVEHGLGTKGANVGKDDKLQDLIDKLTAGEADTD